MKREECIALLERYAEYDGMGIPNLAGCKEAMKMAADLLSQPSLPSELDEAAIDAAQLDMQDRQIMEDSNEHRMLYSRIFRRGFKAGAEWMAGQGWSLEGEVKDQPTGGGDFEIYLDYDMDKMENILDKICDYVNANFPDDNNRYKVILQIRKNINPAKN